MARVTVEDCLKNVKNRFELVIIAAKRARQLMRGRPARVEWDNDKPTVVALREIAAGFTDMDTPDAQQEEVTNHFSVAVSPINKPQISGKNPYERRRIITTAFHPRAKSALGPSSGFATFSPASRGRRKNIFYLKSYFPSPSRAKHGLGEGARRADEGPSAASSREGQHHSSNNSAAA